MTSPSSPKRPDWLLESPVYSVPSLFPKKLWSRGKTDYRMNVVALFAETSRLALGVSCLFSSRFFPKKLWTRRKTDFRMNDVALFAETSRLALGVSCLFSSQDLSQGLSGRGVNLTTHVHMVSRLRMSGDMVLLFL
jgi:hypothetical protein